MINFIKKRGFIFVMILALLVPGLIVNASTNSTEDTVYEQNQNAEDKDTHSGTASKTSDKKETSSGENSTANAASQLPAKAAEEKQNTASTETTAASSSAEAKTAPSSDTIASKAESSKISPASSKPAQKNDGNSQEFAVADSNKSCNVPGAVNSFLDCLKNSQKNGKECLTDIQQCLENWNKTGDCQPICDETSEENSDCTNPEENVPTPTAPPAEENSIPESEVPSGSGNTDNASFEERVATLVNEQRAANGLSPLTLDYSLSNVARAKSQDMHDNNYFAHTSPTYGSPFEMMTAFGISYRTAGENIAMGYNTPEAVMEGWMNSEGHRANILNGSFTTIGVGYVADGNYWTQEFTG